MELLTCATFKVSSRLSLSFLWRGFLSPLSHSDLLQQISGEVAQLASGADLQVAAFLVSFLHHNLEGRQTAAQTHVLESLSPTPALLLNVIYNSSPFKTCPTHTHTQKDAQRGLSPGLSSGWSVPSLCSPQMSGSPCKPSRSPALWWGSWWGSSQFSHPSCPVKRMQSDQHSLSQHRKPTPN